MDAGRIQRKIYARLARRDVHAPRRWRVPHRWVADLGGGAGQWGSRVVAVGQPDGDAVGQSNGDSVSQLHGYFVSHSVNQSAGHSDDQLLCYSVHRPNSGRCDCNAHTDRQRNADGYCVGDANACSYFHADCSP